MVNLVKERLDFGNICIVTKNLGDFRLERVKIRQFCPQNANHGIFDAEFSLEYHFHKNWSNQQCQRYHFETVGGTPLP